MLSLADSFDSQTAVFYRSPEHPRLRTAQACEKCRTRKAKCSGEHPACKRCLLRNLTCEYAKEGRVRGANKPKFKLTPSASVSPSASATVSSPSSGSSSKSSCSPTSTTKSVAASARPPTLRLHSKYHQQLAEPESLCQPYGVETRARACHA